MFTTINSVNSNLWKSYNSIPILYNLFVDISVNTITINYKYYRTQYIIVDKFGPEGYMGNTLIDITINPSSYIITDLFPNTYYNYGLTPYNNLDISGIYYYFDGFISGSSRYTSSRTTITDTSIPINYSNLIKPLCTLSAIYNLVISTYDFSSVDISFNYTDLSYVSIVQTGGSNNSYNKKFQELSGTLDLTTQKYSLNSRIINSGLKINTSYTYKVTPYNNLNIPGIQLTVSGVSWPSFLNNIIGYTIDNYSSVTQLNVSNNYIFITFSSSGTIQFKKSITGNILLVGGGGSGGYKGGGLSGGNGTKVAGPGGGGGYISNSYNFTELNNYNFTIGLKGTSGGKGGTTTLKINTTTIYSANGGNAGGNGENTSKGAPGSSGNGNSGGSESAASGYSQYIGGGGGAGGKGYNVININGSLAGGGNGGPGYLWPYNNKYYGYGGGGSPYRKPFAYYLQYYPTSLGISSFNLPYSGCGSSGTDPSGNSVSINASSSFPGSGGGSGLVNNSWGGNGSDGIAIIAINLY